MLFLFLISLVRIILGTVSLVPFVNFVTCVSQFQFDRVKLSEDAAYKGHLLCVFCN
jgi:hypothetical protein